jgi:hypothetical protein
MPRIRTVAALGTAAFVLFAAGAASAASPLGTNLGPAKGSGMLKSYLGYYDAHKDSYVITDVSSKSQAAALHINYSAAIGSVKGAPRQFFIMGKAAPGQITVWGSEPGESDYNPLWEEIFVTWKPGVTPVVLKSDNQIDSLQKAGKLTETDAHIVLNAPITHVGK